MNQNCMITREAALEFGLSFQNTYTERPFRDQSPTKKIYEAVKQIPKGCVATYGQVAEMAGNPRMSRAVGNALHKNPDPEHIPCYRVVNFRGELSGAFAFGGKDVQKKLLEADGIEVVNGTVDLKKYGLTQRDDKL